MYVTIVNTNLELIQAIERDESSSHRTDMTWLAGQMKRPVFDGYFWLPSTCLSA